MKQTKTKIPKETTKVVNAVTGESEPIKYIKAKTTDLQDPKRLAVLKAIVGSRIHGFSSILVLTEPSICTPFLVTSFFVSTFLKEILIPINTIKLEPRLLIGEDIELEMSLKSEHELCDLSNNTLTTQNIEYYDGYEFRITEDTLKEIGFEVITL